MAPRQPNILLVTTDQQRWDTMGALGAPGLHTPTLNRLCAEGTACTRAYCANPLCSPSRASLLTGLLPSRHGCWTVGVPLRHTRTTLAHRLRRLGYTTALIGKGHLQPCLWPGSPEAAPAIFSLEHFAGWRGPYYGFERCALTIGHTCEPHAAGMHYGLWLRCQGVDSSAFFGGQRSHELANAPGGRWDLPPQWHSSHWVADLAIRQLHTWARRDRTQPFLLWASFPDPHPPFVAPEPWYSRQVALGDAGTPPTAAPDRWIDRPALYGAALEGRAAAHWPEDTLPPAGFDPGLDHRTIPADATRRWRHAYFAMIAQVDHHLGRILAALDECGQADRTLVVFTSDHGELLGDNGLWGKGPFHVESVLRVPLLWRWPGRIPAGRRCAALFSLMDLMPTLLGAAGGAVPAGLDGLDQGAVLWQDAPGPREAVRIENRATPGLQLQTVVTHRYKLTTHLPGDTGELYDLEADPHECRNLWRDPDHAELRRRLAAKLPAQLDPPPGQLAPRLAYA